MVSGLGDMGLSLALAGVGSALGTGVAGMAAIGAWKKAYIQNKAAPFLLVAFIGAPVTQTIYGFLVKNAILGANLPAEAYPYQMIIGAVAGIAMGTSAWMQGKAGARAADALAESGKGFANYIIALGVIESVALLVMVFTMIALPT